MTIHSWRILNTPVGHVRARLFNYNYLRWKSSSKPNVESALLTLSESKPSNVALNHWNSQNNINPTKFAMTFGGNCSFGIAKDKPPSSRRTKKNLVYKDEPPTRYDSVYLQNIQTNNKSKSRRNYTQTWTEFPSGRVRPVTEWGNAHPHEED